MNTETETELTKVEKFEKAHGLELQACSPIESRSFVNVPGITFTEIRKYAWPAKNSGRKYETTVIIGVYRNGTFSAFTPMVTV